MRGIPHDMGQGKREEEEGGKKEKERSGEGERERERERERLYSACALYMLHHAHMHEAMRVSGPLD